MLLEVSVNMLLLNETRDGVVNHRVLLVTRHFPTQLVAGNLIYLAYVVSLLKNSADEVLVTVVGDRFANNEYIVRDPSSAGVSYVSAFSKAVFSLQIIWGTKFVLKNSARRLWALLPSSIRALVAECYADRHARGKTRERAASDRFGGMASTQEAADSFVLSQVYRFRPTHVLFDSTEVLSAFEALHRIDVVLGVICHDLNSSRYAKAAEAGVTAKQRSDLHQISESEEFAQLSAADIIFSIQRAEATRIAQNITSHVAYLPYLPAVRARSSLGAAQALGRRILFVGSAGTPNVTGINWFLTRSWPAILAKEPYASLDVIGAVGNVIKHDFERVAFHGPVPNLRPYYDSANVVIVPLRFGSGLKIKLVEALAAGCACVTTSIGAQGLEEGGGDAFLIADDAEEFAICVLRLLRDRSKQETLRSKALRFAEKQLHQIDAATTVRQALNVPKRKKPQTVDAERGATR